MMYCNARKKGNGHLDKIEPAEEHGGEGYCKNPAGKGTDHKGIGRCKFHDGAPVKHGYYSKYLKNSLGDRLEEMAENEDILELRRTIAAQQEVLLKLLKQMEGDTTDPELLETINRVAEGIGRNRKRLHSIEEGESLHLHVEEIQRVVTRVVKVVQEEADGDTADRIGQRLKEEIKL